MTPDRRLLPHEQVAPLSPGVVSTLRVFALWSAAAVVLLAILGLLTARLRPSLGPVAPTRPLPLAPSAALAFALAGTSLLLKQREQSAGRAKHVANTAAIGVLVLGLLDIVLYLLRVDPTAGPLAGVFATRMAPTSAVLFVATGFGLLSLDVEHRQGHRPTQTLFLVIALFTIAALGASFFGAFTPKRSAPYSSMSWPTAGLFLLLSLGALSARPDRGAMRVLTVDAVGGVVARRLMPAALLGPLVLCILCYLGFLAGWYGSTFGLAILTTLNSAVLTTLVWRTAGALNQSDARRRTSEAQKQALDVALQEAHAFREKVMDSAVFAVFALNMEGRFTLVNRRLEEISGRSTEELLGTDFESLLPREAPSAPSFITSLQKALLEGADDYRTEMEMVRRDGACVLMAYGWSALIVDGKQVGFVGTAEDVTDRRKAEAELRAHQAQIEALNVRLRSAMAETHHRVRNNLQIISALADMQVMSGRDDVPVSEVRRIGSQVQALAAVHDLLTREAKSDAGADTLRVGEVLGKLAALLQQTVKDRKIVVESDQTIINGRQASAIVVVANELVINALKNSRLDIEVRFEAEGGEASLSILDRGPGFPDGFDPMTRASTGLELVHQLAVWDLQGDVRFDNRPEGGACVRVRIPLTRSPSNRR